MNLFKAEQLAVVMAGLNGLHESTSFGVAMGQGGGPPDVLIAQRLPVVFGHAATLFRETGLSKSLQQLQLVESFLGTMRPITVAALDVQLLRIIENVILEARERKFLYVAPDRTEYIENDRLLGEAVCKRFPLAKTDIAAAGNCLAAECWTAGVFHLMRAFEWALRTICTELGFKRMREFDKKSGRFKYMPASFAIWEKIINQLPARVEKRTKGLRPGPRKQQLQEYYSSAIEDIKAVKDAWRNHVMHNRQDFNREDAHAVFSHVKSIMKRLSKGTKEYTIANA